MRGHTPNSLEIYIANGYNHYLLSKNLMPEYVSTGTVDINR